MCLHIVMYLISIPQWWLPKFRSLSPLSALYTIAPPPPVTLSPRLSLLFLSSLTLPVPSDMYKQHKTSIGILDFWNDAGLTPCNWGDQLQVRVPTSQTYPSCSWFFLIRFSFYDLWKGENAIWVNKHFKSISQKKKKIFIMELVINFVLGIIGEENFYLSL